MHQVAPFVAPIHWIQDRVTVLGYAIGETEALFDKAEVRCNGLRVGYTPWKIHGWFTYKSPI